MPEYSVFISKSAQKQLDNFTDNIAAPLLKAIEKLAENPRPYGNKKLKGRDGYRIRIGNYRVIYEIQDKKLMVLIIAVGHRKNIYQ